MTVKPARKPRRLSQKQRADRIAARQRALEKVQAELEELEAQEEAYQLERLNKAWEGIRKDLSKALDIEDADEVGALRDALGEAEIQEILRYAMTGEETAEEEVVGVLEEAIEASQEPVEDSVAVDVESEPEDAPESVDEPSSSFSWPQN